MVLFAAAQLYSTVTSIHISTANVCTQKPGVGEIQIQKRCFIKLQHVSLRSLHLNISFKLEDTLS